MVGHVDTDARAPQEALRPAPKRKWFGVLRRMSGPDCGGSLYNPKVGGSPNARRNSEGRFDTRGRERSPLGFPRGLPGRLHRGLRPDGAHLHERAGKKARHRELVRTALFRDLPHGERPLRVPLAYDAGGPSKPRHSLLRGNAPHAQRPRSRARSRRHSPRGHEPGRGSIAPAAATEIGIHARRAPRGGLEAQEPVGFEIPPPGFLVDVWAPGRWTPGRNERRIARPLRSEVLAMKIILSLLFVMVPLQTEELPHAFPREGVSQIFDNERVTIWDVTWIKGKPSPMHRHKYDLVGVYLAGSPIKVTMPDGTSRESKVEEGFVLFQPKGVTHIEEGLVDKNPRHAILIDLKDHEAAPIPNSTGVPAAFPPGGAVNRLENERVAIWEYRWTGH